MLKPPAANMPGMTDTLDFVKNLWGSMNLPGASLSGMSAPPMSADDLDKRIADLKAVESWLNMNLTMLRGTIQAMEVQRATLGTLKAMGASMAEAMRQSGVSAEKMAGMPFASFFGQAETKADAKPDAKADAKAAPQANAAAGGQPGAGGASAQPGTAAPAGDPSAAAAMGMPAALAWWNMLQDQFQQAVTSAMTPPPESAPKPDAKGAPAATPPQPAAEAPAGPNGRSRAAKPKADKA